MPKIERRGGRFVSKDGEIKVLKTKIKQKDEEIEDLKAQIRTLTPKTYTKTTQTLKNTSIQSTQTRNITEPKTTKSTRPKRPKPPSPPPDDPSFNHTIWNDNQLKRYIHHVRTLYDFRHFFSLSLIFFAAVVLFLFI